jgi:hypothetical protein
MSDYVKNTNFAVKDGYTTGDPRKTVKGTELDDEFNSIAGAVSSKADLASPLLTGTPAAPTASDGTNTTQIATTAFVIGERTSTSTLTNKTLTAPVLTAPVLGTPNSGTLTNCTDLPIVNGTTGTLSVARGGTGLSSVGTSGNVLTSNGTAWVSSAPSGGVTSLNGQTGAITNTDLYAIGSYIVGRPANYTTYSVNSTIAGSSLYTCGVISYYDGGSFKNGYTFTANSGGAALINTGTWRATSAAVNGGETNAQPGLWVRIS